MYIGHRVYRHVCVHVGIEPTQSWSKRPIVWSLAQQDGFYICAQVQCNRIHYEHTREQTNIYGRNTISSEWVVWRQAR